MTRLTKLYSVVLLLLLICLSESTYALNDALEGTRPRVPRTNWENSMGHQGDEMCIILLADNTLRINLYIGTGLSNMDAFPPLMVEYDWGGYLTGVTDKINDNDLVPTIINGYNGFEAKFVFEININDKCSGPNPQVDPWAFHFEYRLVTEENGTFIDYPVLQTPFLFPVTMFPELGKPNYRPFYFGDKFLCCASPEPNFGGAFIQNSNTPVTAATDKGSTILQENRVVASEEMISLNGNASDLTIETTSIYPNPVDNLLNIDLTILEGNFYQIDLIDINGMTVKSIYKEVDNAGEFKEVMNLSGLSSGMYFCRINSAKQFQTHKLIKL